MFKMRKSLIALLSVLALMAAACGSDEDSTASDDTTTTVAVDDTEAPEEPAETDAPTETDPPADDPVEEPEVSVLDSNGDGTVTFGVATPGPRDDGAFYQSLVEGVEAFSAEQGFEEPIIVDNIPIADAEIELRNLARQNVDVIAIGAGELSDPLEALSAEFAEIFWYCNCGAGVQPVEGLAQATDDSGQISYTAGVATAALMQESGATAAFFLGCCDLDFEQEAFNAWALGISDVDESYTSTYIPTGDFNDVAGATEAFTQALDSGMGAVYPFLGGAHEAVVGLANENDVITMSAGASDACERTDLSYQMAVQFDAGDYLATTFDLILAGEFDEGDVLVFTPGEYEFVGAKLCDGSAEAEAQLADAKERLAAGELGEELFEIAAAAYGF
jgi:basic membrane protein A